jgi:pimeloyl-ACP methyl ester carboxylesterase
MRLLRFVFSFFIGTATGCAVSGARLAEGTAAVEAPRPTVLVFLPGIAGTRISHASILDTLVEEKAVDRVELIDWVGNRIGLRALMEREKNHELARGIAVRLRELRAHPSRPRVILAAHSGGASLAVWALEELGPEEKIEGLMLFAPALSPEYDLSKALSRVDRAYSFYGEYDRVLLQLGTNLFGTADGVRTDAAGRVGFREPAGAEQGQYAKLEQVQITYEQLRVPTILAHIAMFEPSYVRAEVVRRVRGDASHR